MFTLPIMSTALAFTCTGGIISLWKYRGNSNTEIINDWNDIMRHTNLYNKDADNTGKDKILSTFEVYKCFKTDYGYKLIVTIPKGQKYSTLEDNKEIIENGLKSNVAFEENKFSATATVKVNNEPFDLDEKWKPVEDTKPNELYVGRDFFKKDIIVDMDKMPHILITGSTGTGKSMELFSIVTNLISNFSEKEIGLWLAQVSDKKDVQMFKNCKQTRFFAWTLDGAYKMLKHIRIIIKERNAIINECGVNNIYEYNRKFSKSKDKQMPYEYIVIDEYKSFMVDDTKNLDINYYIKQKCNVELQHIIQESRSVGIFFIDSVLRSDLSSINPNAKNLHNNRINFRQNNMASALVTSNSPKDIIGIPNREAYFEGYESFHIKTLYLDNSIINKYISESIEKNHKYVDIANYSNLNESSQKPREINTIQTKNSYKSKENKQTQGGLKRGIKL